MNPDQRRCVKRALFVAVSIALSACSPNEEQASPKRVAPADHTASKAGSVISDSLGQEAGSPQFVHTPPAQIASLSIAEGGKCSIDSINSKESDIGWTVRRNEVITVGGWVLDLVTKTTSDWAVLRLDAPDGSTHFYASTTVRGERADLFRVLGDGPGLKKATFTLVVTPGQVPPASYKLALLHQSEQGGQACTVQKTLSIVP
jgi:hypothetical protein